MPKLDRGAFATSPVFRLLGIGLLVVLCVLSYNYWSVLRAYRGNNEKLTRLTTDYEELTSAKSEAEKKLEACSDQLKITADENKQLKDQLSEKDRKVTELQNDLLQIRESLIKSEEGKVAAEKSVQNEKLLCIDSSKVLEENCKKTCDDTLKSAVTAADDKCRAYVEQLQKSIPGAQAAAGSPDAFGHPGDSLLQNAAAAAAPVVNDNRESMNNVPIANNVQPGQ